MATATAPPPTYEAAVSEIEKFTTNLTPETQHQISEKALALFEDKEWTELLMERVRELANDTIDINQCFIHVSDELKLVDDENYNDGKGKPIPKLKPTWDGFYERFKNLLWDSRHTAVETTAYVSDFHKNLLPAIDDTIAKMADASDAERKRLLDELRPDLDEFIKKQNPAGRPVDHDASHRSVAEKHSQDFLNLKRDINSFSESFKAFTGDALPELAKRIKELETEINTYTAEVEKYTELIKEWWVRFGVTGALTIGGALVGLFVFGPFAAGAVLLIGCIAAIVELGFIATYIGEQTTAQHKLDDARSRKADLEKQLQRLVSLQTKLETQTKSINAICGRLDQFANIWASVSAGAVSLKLELEGVSGTHGYAVLKNRVKQLKHGYSCLSSALTVYATHVDDSKVPKPA